MRKFEGARVPVSQTYSDATVWVMGHVGRWSTLIWSLWSLAIVNAPSSALIRARYNPTEVAL